jgi:hypothetical protein
MVGGNIHVEVYTVDGTYISGQVLQLRDDLAIVGAMPLEDGPHWYGHVVLLAHITRIEVRVQAPTLI